MDSFELVKINNKLIDEALGFLRQPDTEGAFQEFVKLNIACATIEPPIKHPDTIPLETIMKCFRAEEKSISECNAPTAFQFGTKPRDAHLGLTNYVNRRLNGKESEAA